MTAAPLTAEQNTAHYTELSRSFVWLLGAALRDKAQKSIKDLDSSGNGEAQHNPP